LKTAEEFFTRAEKILKALELLLPRERDQELKSALAWKWKKDRYFSELEAITDLNQIDLDDLLHIDRQKTTLVQNTKQFLEDLPANNALLWGPRGTGKSSLVRALLNGYVNRGLRLIEVDRHDLIDLPEIIERIKSEKFKFIIYCDDLSFNEDDETYRALKTVLDGSVRATPTNVLIYATSNRRHLLPENQQDNQKSQVINGELHLDEAIEEKISLSERFGLWLSFHPLDQNRYLDIVNHWLAAFGADENQRQDAKKEALQWALSRGSRSGRSANQFARDWLGRSKLKDIETC
jgi:predicted AAA+ superfamily ATPase